MLWGGSAEENWNTSPKVLLGFEKVRGYLLGFEVDFVNLKQGYC